MSITIRDSNPAFRKNPIPLNASERSQQAHPTFSSRELSLINGKGNTFLHISVMNGHTFFVKKAIETAKKIGRIDLLAIQNKDGDTPLHLAIKEKRGAIVKLLVANMSLESLELRNDDGYTAHDLKMHSEGRIPKRSNDPRKKFLKTVQEGACQLSESQE